MKKVHEMNAASAGGFQLPLGARNDVPIRKVLSVAKLSEEQIKFFMSSVDAKTAESFNAAIDAGRMTEAVEIAKKFVTEAAVRVMIRNRLGEIVRRKPGGGGYKLYSPNQGKKKQAKPVGEFPTKLAAKKAELSRFPPKDVAKLKRLRHEIERLQKDPEKRVEKERQWAHPEQNKSKLKNKKKPEKKKDTKKEALELVRDALREALFREEPEASVWDERVAKLSKAAVSADRKLQNLQKNIEKKSEGVLTSAFQAVSKALKKSKIVAKADQVQKDMARQKTFLPFKVSINKSEVGPLYVFIEGGAPKIEISDEAKMALAKVDPGISKVLRAELITVQEQVLDGMQDVAGAVAARDKYLSKLEQKVDGFVSDLNALEISVLKSLLVQKYRGK